MDHIVDFRLREVAESFIHDGRDAVIFPNTIKTVIHERSAEFRNR